MSNIKAALSIARRQAGGTVGEGDKPNPIGSMIDQIDKQRKEMLRSRIEDNIRNKIYPPEMFYNFIPSRKSGDAMDYNSEDPGIYTSVYGFPPQGLATGGAVNLGKFKRISQKLGGNAGGIFKSPAGDEWYVKVPRSTEVAKNEKLASELYQLAGIPVADFSLTKWRGKTALASKMVHGKELNRFKAADFPKIKKLQDGVPADAWLSNYDVVGLYYDNIIVDNNNVAHRIDLGGALRFRAKGGKKPWWGPKVIDFETMFNPKINRFANRVFSTRKLAPDVIREITKRRKKTAERIANIPDDIIKDLVAEYGPIGVRERGKLAEDIIVRRDQVAARYGVKVPKKFQEGGVVDDNEPPAPMPGVEAQMGMSQDISQVGPLHTVGKVVSGLGRQAIDWIKTPGEVMEGPRQITPETPGQWTEEDQFRQSLANQQHEERQAQFGAETALNMYGTSAPFAKLGTPGVAGGKPPIAKDVDIHSLHPSEIDQAQQLTGSLGSNPGGTYQLKNGEQVYVKTPQTKNVNEALERVNNEKLASELYKLAGVPVAEYKTTTLNNKPAIASSIIHGTELNGYHPYEYNNISDLSKHFPADAWLANYDVVGLNHDNILVDAENKAHRIDLGGALRFRAQGKPKEWWGPDVKELDTMLDPQVNPTSHSVFGTTDATGRVETAQRIADIPDKSIRDLVERWGPADQKAKDKLADDIISRRDQVAAHYRVTPQTPPSPTGADIVSQAHNIAKSLVDKHGEDVGVIGDHIWDLANKYGSHTADAVAAKLPSDFLPYLDLQLDYLAEKHGYNPWGQEAHGMPPFEDPFRQIPWEEPPPRGEQKLNLLPKGMDIPQLSEISSQHNLPQILHAVKKQSFFNEHTLSPVQNENILHELHNYNPNEIANAMIDGQMTVDQMKNVYSWLSPDLEKKVDAAIANHFGGEGSLFENAMHAGLHAMDDETAREWGMWLGHPDLHEISQHAQKPPKTAAQIEADRIAGEFKTLAYRGAGYPHGQERLAEGEFHTNKSDVAHAYAAWKNAAAHPTWWDKENQQAPENWKAPSVQRVWLNTKDYITVDADGRSWVEGNAMADNERSLLEAKGIKPKGVIIQNVHDMPHEPYEHPSGEPFTVYRVWDQSTRRSFHARFDPEHWGKPGVHLGIGGIIGGYAVVGSGKNGQAIMFKSGNPDDHS